MEIIGTLAAGVAHDFNNLLQVIIGHTSLILTAAEAGSSLSLGLEKINMAAVRATEITPSNCFRSAARRTKNASCWTLNKIIKESGQLARCTLRRNVTIEIQSAPEPLPVKMDSTRASQALLNLCVNSQDAMPDGGRLSLTNTVVKLSVDLACKVSSSARRTLPPAAALRRRTGCGIALESAAANLSSHVFHHARNEGKGTGISDCPIVQRVAQEAGGFIEVESVLGKGTTFHLYLPLTREEIMPVTAPRQTALAQSKGRVLVVDDVDLRVRDFAQKFLQMAGLTVLVAGSGHGSAASFWKTPTNLWDIMFTDYNMPGMERH